MHQIRFRLELRVLLLRGGRKGERKEGRGRGKGNRVRRERRRERGGCSPPNENPAYATDACVCMVTGFTILFKLPRELDMSYCH